MTKSLFYFSVSFLILTAFGCGSTPAEHQDPAPAVTPEPMVTPTPVVKQEPVVTPTPVVKPEPVVVPVILTIDELKAQLHSGVPVEKVKDSVGHYKNTGYKLAEALQNILGDTGKIEIPVGKLTMLSPDNMNEMELHSGSNDHFKILE